jgi:hypothetical protein
MFALARSRRLIPGTVGLFGILDMTRELAGQRATVTTAGLFGLDDDAAGPTRSGSLTASATLWLRSLSSSVTFRRRGGRTRHCAPVGWTCCGGTQLIGTWRRLKV